MPKQEDPAAMVRAIRLVDKRLGGSPSLGATAKPVGKQLGIGQETVRRRAVQSQLDSGQRAGVSSEENEEIKRLKNENPRLREDVTTLRTAVSFFVREPDPHNR